MKNVVLENYAQEVISIQNSLRIDGKMYEFYINSIHKSINESNRNNIDIEKILNKIIQFYGLEL